MKVTLLISFLFLPLGLINANGQEYLPVLCFHSFYEEEPDNGTLSESYARLEELLNFLKSNGYQSITHHDSRDEHQIMLTFDDGHKSQYKAAGLLEEFGFRGVFFIVPGLINDPEYDHLTKKQIRDLADRGHEIGIHGYNHESVVESRKELKRSLDISGKEFHRLTGLDIEIISFAFPFGHYDTESFQELNQEYLYLHTVNPGYWDGTSANVPRLLISRQKELSFYFDYIKQSRKFKPAVYFEYSDANRSRQSQVNISIDENLDPNAMYLLSPAADISGKHYKPRTLSNFFEKKNERYSINLSDFVAEFYKEERSVLSLAIVQLHEDEIIYLSNGELFWID